MTLPSWYPAEEAKAAPAPLLLVQAFLNTRDLEEQSDVLSEHATARAWLTQAELLPADARFTAADLDLARGVREGIRGLLAGTDASRRARADLAPLRELADAHALRLTVAQDGMLALAARRREDLADGLFDLLVLVWRSQDRGSWERLKACANPDCRWVFYDRSRNRHGNWCDMAVCGNRLKNRSLRARRR